jgi:hypothetical protein
MVERVPLRIAEINDQVVGGEILHVQLVRVHGHEW